MSSRLGYEGSYMKRVDDNIDEGGATFVRTNRFTVVSQKGIALRDLAFKVIIIEIRFLIKLFC